MEESCGRKKNCVFSKILNDRTRFSPCDHPFFEQDLRMDANLRLKNKPNIIGAASNFTYHWGINSGLDRQLATRLAVAVSELVTDVVLFAFGEQEGEMELTFYRHEDRVEVIVHELGEPFNPDRHRYDRERAIRDGNFVGAGFELVQKLTGEFVFLNRGKQGKEFHLVQHIPAPHIEELVARNELRGKVGQQDGRQKSYGYFPITPDDAEDISKLIYRIYGHTYYKEKVYFPRQVALSIEQKEKFGVIVRTGEGQPVGYFALLRSTDSNIAEVGQAVVAVEHRQKGLMKGMLKRLIAMAHERGLVGIYGEATAVHTVSQRVNSRFGLRTTAIMLAISPSMALKGFDERAYSQDVSLVFEFLPLKPISVRKLFLPEVYRSVLEEIYRDLGFAVEACPDKVKRLPDLSDLEVQINGEDRYALIVVRRYGRDFNSQAELVIRDLDANDLQTIAIDLPLFHPDTCNRIESLRGLGFIFSGLMPLFHQERDYLRMQRTRAPLDFDLIQVFSPMACRLKEIIQEEYHETQKGRGQIVSEN